MILGPHLALSSSCAIRQCFPVHTLKQIYLSLAARAGEVISTCINERVIVPVDYHTVHIIPLPSYLALRASSPPKSSHLNAERVLPVVSTEWLY